MTPVHTKAGCFYDPFPLAQRPYQPDTRRKSRFQVRRLCRLPGTKAGFSGTEAWVAPGLWGVTNCAFTMLSL